MHQLHTETYRIWAACSVFPADMTVTVRHDAQLTMTILARPGPKSYKRPALRDFSCDNPVHRINEIRGVGCWQARKAWNTQAVCRVVGTPDKTAYLHLVRARLNAPRPFMDN